ncbi:MAG: glycosyltransferase family 9 protein, partial [Spirochaetes bacterium]|nr:glycosyltransferase family 9 protein [Spirochaetota bacterium]
SEMGSTILADAALREARASGAEIYFAIFRRNAASLSLLGTVPSANVFMLREHNFGVFLWDTLRFLIWTRRHKIDTVVDLELFSRFTSLLTAFSGAARRVGFHAFHNEGLYRGNVLNIRVAYNPHIHIAKNFMALVKSAFASQKDLPFYKGKIDNSAIAAGKATISREAVLRVRAALKQHGAPAGAALVLLNCAGGEFLMQRRWPPEYYARLTQMILAKKKKAFVLLTGSPAERPELDLIRAAVGDERCLNFAGAVAFADLPALYSLSRMLVTNDSGPAHFASTTDIRTFAFFGPETPALYGSLGNFTPIYAHYACSPCVTAFNHRKTPCRDNQCLKVIGPAEVYERIARYI